MRLNTIRKLYDELNTANFGGRMERPVIRFLRGEAEAKVQDLGRNRPRMRFNPFAAKTVREMRATVYHEMVHQYLDYHLGVDQEEDHHGELFWLVYFTHATPSFDWETPYSGEYYE